MTSINRGRIEGHTHIGDVEIRKRIVNVQRAGFYGHLHADFEDGTSRVLQIDEHDIYDLKPGDWWPPFPKPSQEPSPLQEDANAMDAQAGQEIAVVGESVVEPAESQDESGAPSGPQPGSQAQGKQGPEA